MRSTLLALALLLAAAATGCQKDKAGSQAGTGTATGTTAATGTGTGSGTGAALKPPGADAKDIDSKDILARTTTADEVHVKHVLIGWKDLEKIYRGRMDPRAAARSNDEAAAFAEQVAATLRADPKAIDAQVKEHSEDPGSQMGEPYTVTAAARLMPEFKNLALRLALDEVGIVKTGYGYHVMQRVPPPPLDPLESADILARPAGTAAIQVQHILIGWKDAPANQQQAPDPRAAERTKEAADKLATEVLAKVRAGGDMAKLMKEFSEDPGSKDSAMPYDVSPAAGMVEPFKRLSMRLDLNEAGLVKTVFGWHIIKRIPPPPPPPPPPPDALDSVDILARAPVSAKGKVKHILLGWTEKNAGDPRGKARDRKTLEALVKKTVAELKKGAKIEDLMKELSEDPGSAQSGNSYDYDPNAGLVQPFKDLSLRLNVGEVGVVKTEFGIHIIKRIE